MIETVKEVWKPISGYENLYEVSNLGRVKSIKYHTNRVLKPKTNKKYNCNNLCKHSVTSTIDVHRMVAIAFVPNPDNKPHVNHIDNNRRNNAALNLEWVTPKENNNRKSKYLSISELDILMNSIPVDSSAKYLYSRIKELVNSHDSCYIKS